MPSVRVRVSLPATPARGYEIRIGNGVLAAGVAELIELSAGASWLVISDDTVIEHWGAGIVAALQAAGSRVETLVFAAGERSKTRDTVADLQDRAITAGHGRDTWVLAVGGGVVGDLAGYTAATLFRGLAYVQVPTSLLAMVDSAVGGKTGIDTDAGKNLVGAFHQPRLVLADVETLKTLPDAELRAGLGEVIKYGVSLDEELFTDLEDGLVESCLARVPEALTLVVQRCVTLKAQVVAEDERESNRRQVLNFGHTVAHAIEALRGFGIRHGEAVAIGMVCEARLAQQCVRAPSDLAQRVAELCIRAGLPTTVPVDLDVSELVTAARRDKKTRGGAIRCALPRELGVMAKVKGQWAVEVSDTDLAASLRVPSE